LFHSHLGTNLDVLDVILTLKGKFLVSLVELEKGKKYYVNLWVVDEDKFIWGEEIDGHVTEIERCASNSRVFSLVGPNYFKIYKFDYEKHEIGKTTEYDVKVKV